MNIREFAKLIAGQASPAERSNIVKRLLNAMILPDLSKPKKVKRSHHQRAGNARYAARRRQKDSRREQRNKSIYRRAC